MSKKKMTVRNLLSNTSGGKNRMISELTQDGKTIWRGVESEHYKPSKITIYFDYFSCAMAWAEFNLDISGGLEVLINRGVCGFAYES